MWSLTLSGEHGNNIYLYQEEDPFGIYGSIISITTEIHKEDSEGEKTVYGIIGMHFNTTIF